jgi:phosphotransferase system enzyme I (PtsI)
VSAAIEKGIAVSPGVSIGRALVLETRDVSIYRVPISERNLERELQRWQQGLAEAKRQIQQLRHRVQAEMGDTYSAIFDAHLLLLEDRGLIDAVERKIREQKVNAEWALKENVEEHLQVFQNLNDTYFQERGGDLEDVHRRLQRILAGSAVHHDLSELTEDVVVVAPTLSPSDTALLNKEHVIGIAIDVGSRTSHTAIIANALEIPAVVGLHSFSDKVSTGDLLIVDGERGHVLVNPDPDQVREYERRRSEWEHREQELLKLRDLPAVTEDGVEIVLLANIELPDEVETALRRGASGIGLYRSEFLYLQRSPALPSEEDHYQAYRALAERVKPRTAIIRTLDLGGEKYFQAVLEHEEVNPVMGVRALRFCLRRPELFRTQLRGILRASAHGSIRLMFPMVSGVGELRQAKTFLDQVRQDLRREGVPFDERLPVGIMIEVPSAAAVADLLAREVDFFSIGTNDLIQYSLAIDRGNESVSYLYEPLHPAILRQVKFVTEAARQRGIPVSLCGEMAADPLGMAVLIGLGLTELSLNPLSIPSIKNVIRRLNAADLQHLAARVVDMSTALEIQEYLLRELLPRMPEGFSCPVR